MNNYKVDNGEDRDAIIVTRHDVVERFFKEVMGINARRVDYARIYEIRGKKVYGVLPLAFIGEVKTFTTVHNKYRDDAIIDKMTLEEYCENIIDVREYTVDFKRVGGWYEKFQAKRFDGMDCK